MTQPSADETLLVGQIVATFGVRGQVKMRSYTDYPDHLRRRVRQVFIGPKRQPYTITQIVVHKPDLMLLTLEGITTREAAEDLIGAEVSILEHQAAPLAPGEYFIHQLYNLLVVTEDGAELGRVRDVLTTGANEVLVVARPGKSEALLPMIQDVVRSLDIPAGRVVVHLLPGLIED